MIAFCDTNVHVDLLAGTLSFAQVLQAVGGGPVRLSPIVASELLCGARGPARAAVDALVDRLHPVEPPSWRRCWIEAGRLLPTLLPDHEDIGFARLQNDTLLALTARHTGTLFVTGDRHFATIRRHVPFALRLLPG